MTDSRQVTEGGPARGGAVPRRGRAAATAAFAAVLVAGLGLAAACGGGSGSGGEGTNGQRAHGAARPSAPPSPPPSPDTRSPSPTAWDPRPGSVAAVGDSITRGFDACSLLADCAKVSWATGSDPRVDSVAQRLVARDPAGHSWNDAASGAVMADLPGQMKRAARHKPELVTVLSGANDACRRTAEDMTPVADFRADFRDALRTLRRASPRSEVYVASVPDLRRLWSQGRESTTVERVWNLGLCPSMLRHPGSMTKTAQDRREQVYERVTAYNEVLAEECARITRCRDDGGAVFEDRFTRAELSRWDFFHPGIKGQHELAEIAYRHITAPEESPGR